MWLLLLAVVSSPAGPPAVTLLDVASDYGDAQLPTPLPSAGWLGLCETPGGFVVREVGVQITPVKVMWDGPGEETGRRVRVTNCPEPKAVFSGLSVAKGAVKTARVEKGKVMMGHSTLSFKVVETEGAPTRLYVIEGKRRMLLSEKPDGGPIKFRIRWAGDLDRDGLPDLLVEEDDEGTRLTLFLSSVGKKETAWEPIASTFHGGC